MDTGDLVATMLALIAIGISFYSLRKTLEYQKYEYAIRLQVENESIHYYPLDTARAIAIELESIGEERDQSLMIKSKEPAFKYEADLTNLSEKPVFIDAIYMGYGSYSDSTKRLKYVVEARFHLAAGNKYVINFCPTQLNIAEVMQRFSTKDIGFSLIVAFYSAQGRLVEAS